MKNGICPRIVQTTHKYTEAGIYTVTLTVSADTRCSATATQTVTINPILSTVVTAKVISQPDAILLTGGMVLEDGGVPVTARGICWSSSPGPTLENSDGFIADTSAGTGEFRIEIPGLSTDDTVYYFRAYATNSTVTAYGSDRILLLPGDVNGDGKVNLQDAILALKVIAGLEPDNVHIGADANGDGKIGMEDVVYILRQVMANP